MRNLQASNDTGLDQSMGRKAARLAAKPHRVGSVALDQRLREAGGGGIDATNPANLPLTSVVTVEAYIHGWDWGTNLWAEGLIVFMPRNIPQPIVFNKGQPDERAFNDPGEQYFFVAPNFEADHATVTFEDAAGNVGVFNLRMPTLLEGEFRPASNAWMQPRTEVTINIGDWELGDSYQHYATSLQALNAIGEIRMLDNDGVPGAAWLPGAGFTYDIMPDAIQGTAHWNGTAWVAGVLPNSEPEPEPEPDPEPTTTVPWDAFTTHAEIDDWAAAQGFSRAEDWGRMNLTAKRKWLVDYFDGATPWATGN